MASINHHLLLAAAAAVLLLAAAATATASRVTVTSLANTTSSSVAALGSSGIIAGGRAANASANTTAAAEPTVYEMLGKYGFPPGILPAGAQGYTLDAGDGSFQVTLPGDCVVDVQGYKLRYRSNIYGNVRAGSIDGLDGVSVKIAIVWVGIHDVEADGGDVTFHASAISKSSPADGFQTSPSCQ
ncbi:uncharacterized protein [Oryza sativa Japonica Group]|uniref:Os11g0241832 protein n=2 Tax=Oryza sativa subsp. japonica TaxID=39947 RepID=Q53Q19_ORYSJ|nr:Protein of unknown function, DUF538, putative [Oryza sativa Japonica Group]ABA92323.1 hypothetical protein LOC_Os11g13770 [Oryza sativa Japonica Group]KAF2910234.1 hypothetical protein DAI22_11g086900 [Oryza sativa Japonica Group]BAT13383.1 Os11g0241832 [Oryza sativa Japonica Group]